MRTYTHPDVLGKGVTEGWADPETDPARIDWPPRQAAAAIPFQVVDGRPVNPCQKTGIRYGRNELGHWGEQLAADAAVTYTDGENHRWLAMVERGDGHGWALPGGCVEPGEDPAAAAVRELAEETGLDLSAERWEFVTKYGHITQMAARYVPDPRASDESWMVTVPHVVRLGGYPAWGVPVLVGADDAKRAEWVRADAYRTLVDYLAEQFGGRVFAAHESMLAELLD